MHVSWYILIPENAQIKASNSISFRKWVFHDPAVSISETSYPPPKHVISAAGKMLILDGDNLFFAKELEKFAKTSKQNTTAADKIDAMKLIQ
jgi:hypothetical protein